MPKDEDPPHHEQWCPRSRPRPRLRAGGRPPSVSRRSLLCPDGRRLCLCPPPPPTWDARLRPRTAELPGCRPGGFGHRLADGLVSNVRSAVAASSSSVVSCPRPFQVLSSRGPACRVVGVHTFRSVACLGVQASRPGRAGSESGSGGGGRGRPAVPCRGPVVGAQSIPSAPCVF